MMSNKISSSFDCSPHIMRLFRKWRKKVTFIFIPYDSIQMLLHHPIKVCWR